MDDLVKLAREYEHEFNSSFIELTIELSRYLRGYEYLVTPSCVIDFFKMTENFNIFNVDDFYGISKTIFCKNRMEYESYEDFFYKFIKKYVRSNMEGLIELEKEKHNRKIDTLKTEFDKEREQLLSKVIEEKKITLGNILTGRSLIIKQQQKQCINLSGDSLKNLNEKIRKIDKSYLKAFLTLDIEKMSEYIQFDKKFPIDKLKQGYNELMMENLADKKCDNELNELLIKASKALAKINELYGEEKTKMTDKIEQKEREYNMQINSEINEYNNKRGSLIKKYGTVSHREEEFVGKNCIQDLANIKGKQISKLTEVEYSTLISYIQINSAKFRTKISRSMKQSKAKVFDYKATMANSIKCYGEPMQLYYKKPVVKKFKLICIMDISGSVAKYITLLSSFLYEINGVFNGGVYTYGFVSDLLDFTEIYNKESLEVAVEKTKGFRGYSNYYKALSDFNENYLNIVDKNTIVIFFGDARNNKNESGLNYLCAIKEKCRGIVWLNPETKKKWNKNDSIIGKYADCIDQLFEVLNTEDLISFMEEFSLKKNNL